MNNGVTAGGNLCDSFFILTNNGCVKLKLVIATENQSQNQLIDPLLQGVRNKLHLKNYGNGA